MIRTLKHYIATDNHENLEYVEISCLSTDTKPMTGIINGSIAQEVDTGKVFFFNEFAGTWVEQFAFGGGGGTVEKFVITLTPTSLDMSGTTDRTLTEIADAIAAGNQIVASLDYNGSTFEIYPQYIVDEAYPYFAITDPINNALVLAYPNNDNQYGTYVYPLTTT